MRVRALVVAAAAAGLLVAGAVPASAHGNDGWGHRDVGDLSRHWHPGHGGGKPPVLGSTTTVAEHLAGPLTFDVDHGGKSIVVGQAFASLLSSVKPGEAPTTLVEEAPGT